MAWRIDAAKSGLGGGLAAVTGGTRAAGPGVGCRYIESMVGRRAAPNGVDKKSVGRSRSGE